MLSTDGAIPPDASDRASGVSLRALGVLALLASVLGRAIVPAIPGLAVGIDAFISWSARASAFVSQLVAVGCVAAVLFLAARVFRLPSLPLAYRLVVFPATAIVVALGIASASGQLPPELCQALVIATASAALAAGVTSLMRTETRAAGLVLVTVALSELSRYVARALAERAAELRDAHALHWSSLAATGSALLDVAAVLIATRYVGGRDPRRASITLGLVIAGSIGVGFFATRGMAPDAHGLEVFALRAIGYFSRPPLPALPLAARYAVVSAPLLIAAGALASRGPRQQTGTVLALCLMSLGAIDMPLPALLVVVAALLARLPMSVPEPSRDPTARSERRARSEPAEQIATALPRR